MRPPVPMALSEQRVLVTGGGGFLGSYIVSQLRARGCRDLFVPRQREYDLRQAAAVSRLYEDVRPDVVIHLAASVGGIGANMRHPGQFFYDNAIMGIQLIDGARRVGVKKFACVGTVCSYPKWTPVPFRESSLWDGYPEETNAPYGLAKKMLLVQLQAYRQEYGTNGIYVILANLYGPGDHFDLDNAHVIPALIRKFIEAKQRHEPQVVVWGTGNATREFLYVEDAADAVLTATERYDGAEPMNVGSGQEITIRDLAELIKQSVGYDGGIFWDRDKPDGQPRRRLDTTRAAQLLGWRAQTTLETGLKRTLEWFQQSAYARTSRQSEGVSA